MNHSTVILSSMRVWRTLFYLLMVRPIESFHVHWQQFSSSPRHKHHHHRRQSLQSSLLQSSSSISTTASGGSTTVIPNQESTWASSSLEGEVLPRAAQLSFSHVHLYTDELQNLHYYKELERNINALGQAIANDSDDDNNDKDNGDDRDDGILRYQTWWNEILQNGSTVTAHAGNHNQVFVPQNRDIVQQLIVGLGFRITATHDTDSNPNDDNDDDEHNRGRHFLLTTQDPHGVQFVISAKDDNDAPSASSTSTTSSSSTTTTTTTTTYAHFLSKNSQEFYNHNSNRQGFAVMGFEVTHGDIQDIYKRYLMLHPTLIVEEYAHGPWIYNTANDTNATTSKATDTNDTITADTATTKVLEVYAYYQKEKGGTVDTKTRLRFIQHDGFNSRDTSAVVPEQQQQQRPLPLPGLQPIHATFDATCMPAYCDHWVSNVISRTGFIETLEETLGFTTKVDFNAGVVAAGEAQIESTVTGNDSFFETEDFVQALKDQSQVYLPINNALSNVGHVHGFLQELGQGIQHIASRVEDLPKFVQRGNDFRKITGEGFTFLNIPRSYYGVLSTKMLVQDAEISEECAMGVFRSLEESAYMCEGGAIALDATADGLIMYLQKSITDHKDLMQEFASKKEDIVDVILRSRFINMYNLLGDSLSTETYLSIVRNQILVDVQGNDLLFQIFTSNVLQKNPNDEAPFLEFIQRVCSVCNDGNRSKVMKAGCGGFGIRNFLTLFLSIEVGKAMLDVAKAKEEEDEIALLFAQQRVDAFTDQLNESNPILTEISDAMTAEGIALENMQKALMDGNEKLAEEYKIALELAEATKMKSNEKLMTCSSKYNQRMKELRLATARALKQ